MDAGITNTEWPKEKYSTIVIDPPLAHIWIPNQRIYK